MEWFFKRDRQASLLLVKVPDAGRYGKVVADDDGRITAFEEKVRNLQKIHLMRSKSGVLNYREDNRHSCRIRKFPQKTRQVRVQTARLSEPSLPNLAQWLGQNRELSASITRRFRIAPSVGLARL